MKRSRASALGSLKATGIGAGVELGSASGAKDWRGTCGAMTSAGTSTTFGQKSSERGSQDIQFVCSSWRRFPCYEKYSPFEDLEADIYSAKDFVSGCYNIVGKAQIQDKKVSHLNKALAVYRL